MAREDAAWHGSATAGNGQAAGRSQFVLPTLVFGLVEVRRLLRELEALEDYLQQSAIHAPGVAAKLPRTSRLLDALAAENHAPLLRADERARLRTGLQAVAASAPTIHMSFAADPSAAFTAKLVTWLRANIHPLILLQIGLQPAIGAGCVVRTANRSFDCSLRHRFSEQQAALLQTLQALGTNA